MQGYIQNHISVTFSRTFAYDLGNVPASELTNKQNICIYKMGWALLT